MAEDRRLLADFGLRGEDAGLAVECSEDNDTGSSPGSAGWKAYSGVIAIVGAAVIMLAICHNTATHTQAYSTDLAAKILKRRNPVVAATKLTASCIPPQCSRPSCPNGEFLYFGYGSNLCEERLKLANPSARYIATAKLEGYKLIFSRKSKTWSGGAADVTRAPGHAVWGVVWAMCNGHSETLDRQEGATSHRNANPFDNIGGYKRITLDVTGQDGRSYTTRSYEVVDKTEGLRPSPGYKATILCGAVEFLPDPYVEKLKSIPDNGYAGEYPTRHGTNLGKWLPYLKAA